MSALLKRHIEPFEKYFSRKGIIEISINKPGEVWLETAQGWEKKKDPSMSLQNLNDFAQVLATYQGQKFSENIPLLSTSIPGWGYRIQVVSGALSESGIAISIRIAQARKFELIDYMSKTEATKLKKAVEANKTILVAGGTGSGKTTFLNSLICYILKETRLLVIEDTKELITDNHDNVVRLIKSKTGTDIAKISYKDIINSCVRLRPDRLLLGELDIENTVPFLRLLNTGHGGSMSTIHADGAKQAIEAIILNARLNGLGDIEAIRQYALQAIDIIVFIERLPGRKFKAKSEKIK
ncbi:MAG: Flp pilus assembly complex ATPase component TadA [Deltaproteobacteria bacterium]|nr:Flp pilus assembly complex ATPase component TadA [Deltaproteobacteria bacterium]